MCPVNFDTAAEANNYIKNLDEELASKYDETANTAKKLQVFLDSWSDSDTESVRYSHLCVRIPVTFNVNHFRNFV